MTDGSSHIEKMMNSIYIRRRRLHERKKLLNLNEIYYKSKSNLTSPSVFILEQVFLSLPWQYLICLSKTVVTEPVSRNWCPLSSLPFIITQTLFIHLVLKLLTFWHIGLRKGFCGIFRKLFKARSFSLFQFYVWSVALQVKTLSW